MRAPFQVLVLPYRKTKSIFEFVVLRRSDSGVWQFVAGGGEDEETPIQAAMRETEEEIGVERCAKYFHLDSKHTMPKYHFSAASTWSRDIYVIPEYCFGVNMQSGEITISTEHTEYLWLTYSEALELLYWDSNKSALWELHERLQDGQVAGAPV